MPAVAPPRWDVAEWLLGDPTAADAAAQRALSAIERSPAPTVRGMTKVNKVARAALSRQITAALRSVLHDDVVEMLVQGWRQHRALVAAAEATAGHRDAEKLVTLAAHEVRFVHEPTVDVMLDGLVLLTLTGRLTVKSKLFDVVAVVRGGRLAALQNGDATVTAVIEVENQEILRRDAQLPLRAVVNLGSGVDLLGAGRRLR